MFAFVFAHVARKLCNVYSVCVGKLPFQIAKKLHLHSPMLYENCFTSILCVLIVLVVTDAEKIILFHKKCVCIASHDRTYLNKTVYH